MLLPSMFGSTSITSALPADCALFSLAATRRRYRALSRAFADAGVGDARLAPAHVIGDPLGSICERE